MRRREINKSKLVKLNIDLDMLKQETLGMKQNSGEYTGDQLTAVWFPSHDYFVIRFCAFLIPVYIFSRSPNGRKLFKTLCIIKVVRLV